MPRRSRRRSKDALTPVPPHGIVGDCPEILRMIRELRRYARISLPVLVFGETGTGKELVAQHLHRASPRRDGPLVVVACPNLPPQLVESELFGHKRGAFTGAIDHREGAFEKADGGTLFLDEIGDMPLDVQAKVLRVLQEGVISRLGESSERRVKVRVVAATWRDLPEMVAAGTFREDLYNRLAYCVVQLPPLRERGHDVVLLARALLAKAREKHGVPRRALSREVEELLPRYDWPGNVRELERALCRASVMGSGRSLRAEDLLAALERPAGLAASVGDARPVEPTAEGLLAERGVMTSSGLRAALGVSATTLSRRLKPLLEQGRVVREGRGAGTRYRWLGVEAVDLPDPRWAVALRLARSEGRVTRGALASALGVSERTATRILAAMVDASLLVASGGRGRAVSYRLPSSP